MKSPIYKSLGLLLALFSHFELCAEESIVVPDRFSSPKINAKRGDVLSLGFESKNKKSNSKWIYQDKVYCAGKKVCQFKTSDWDIGHHKILLNVIDTSSSFTINYEVSLWPKLPSEGSKVVTPEWVSQSSNLIVTRKQDYSAFALEGVGFLVFEKGHKIIEEEPQKLPSWGTLRTNPEGVIKIQNPDNVELVLSNETSLAFTNQSEGGIYFVLLDGGLRIRNHSKKTTWTSFIQDWVQLDATPRADLYLDIETVDERKIARVAALRGNVRVILKGEEYYLPQGSCTVLKDEAVEVLATVCDSSWVKDFFEVTSPNYLIERYEDDANYVTSPYLSPEPKSSQSGLQVAKKSFKKQDYFHALEALRPFSDEAEKSDPVAKHIGIASKELYLFEQAEEYLAHSSRLKPKKADSFYHRGLVAMQQNKYDLALDLLEEASDIDEKFLEKVCYYQGVVSFDLGNMQDAKRHFQYVTRDGEDKDLKSSSIDYLNHIMGNRWIEFSSDLAFMIHSNVLRIESEESLPEGVESFSSYGIDAKQFLRMKLADEVQFSTNIDFEFDQRVYLAPDLSDVSVMQESIIVDFRFLAGKTEEKGSIVTIESQIVNRFLQLGFNDVDREIGWNLETRFDRIFLGPSIIVSDLQNFDFRPDNKKLLDTELFEPLEEQGSRTRRTRVFGLGLQPKNGFLKKLKLLFREVNFSFAEFDKHSDIDLLLTGERSLIKVLELKWRLGYVQRDFPDSTDSRKDSVIELDSRLLYDFIPGFKPYFGLYFKSQNSSRSIKSFSENVLSLGLQYVF